MRHRLASFYLLVVVAAIGCGDGGSSPKATPLPTPTEPPPRAGELDRSFGSEGVVVTDFGGRLDEVNALAVQPDGKIVAVGRSDAPVGVEFAVALARYGADGVLDSAFGDGGRVLLTAVNGSEATAVVLASQGNILVGGTVATPNPEPWLLVRFDSAGRLDAGFGSGGIVQLTVAQGGAFAAAAIQPDGKIVVVGEAFDGASEFALARLEADGTLDATFGTGGIVRTRIGQESVPSAVVLQPDGKIVVGGFASGAVAEFTQSFALARYLPDGTLDATFGSGGIVVTDVTPGRPSLIFALALQMDGAIVARGPSGFEVAEGPSGVDVFGHPGPFVFVRYRSDGALDEGFGTDGILSTDFNSDGQPVATTVQPDGKLLVAPFAFTSGDSFSQAAVARFTAAGTPDPDFASGGVFEMHLRPNDESAIRALALDPDGTLIAGGFSRLTDSTSDFALVRLHLDAR
jgi:uncharacterized delta-60 repeat protein